MDVFVQCSKIEASLRRGSTVECLAWCGENKTSLKKMNVCDPKSTALVEKISLTTYIEYP